MKGWMWRGTMGSEGGIAEEKIDVKGAEERGINKERNRKRRKQIANLRFGKISHCLQIPSLRLFVSFS